MNTARVLNITQNDKGQMYAMAAKRKVYITYLDQHEHNSQMGIDDEIEILEWAKATMISPNHLH